MSESGEGEAFVIEDELDDAENEDGVNGMTEEEREVVRRNRRERGEGAVKRRRLTVGFHHGKLQILPPHWNFPNMTIRQLIENWFVGNVREKVPPYALLKGNHVAHIKTEKNKKAGQIKLRMMRLVMSNVIEHAKSEGCWAENKQDWTIEFTARMWERIGVKYIHALYTPGARKAESSWKSVYNAMVKKPTTGL
jgi:hypothetical protein